MTHLYVVSSLMPMGPRAWSLLVLIATSDPNPSALPSVKRVLVLENTTAASTSDRNFSLVNWFSEDPKRYNLIYLCINWGLPYDNVANLINLKPDRKVLEIACGSALILDYVGDS